jgi:hypothetical protein
MGRRMRGRRTKKEKNASAIDAASESKNCESEQIYFYLNAIVVVIVCVDKMDVDM